MRVLHKLQSQCFDLARKPTYTDSSAGDGKARVEFHLNITRKHKGGFHGFFTGKLRISRVNLGTHAFFTVRHGGLCSANIEKNSPSRPKRNISYQ